MSQPSLTDAQLAEALDYYARFGSQAAAAAALGVARSTFENRLREARRRQALRGETGGPPIPEIGRPPEGFVVSRNSATYDADGNLVRQSVRTQRDAGEPYEVPPGHAVKGESALLDPDGRVLAKWVKTREAGGGDALVEALRQAFAEHADAGPLVPAPAEAADDLLTVYPVPDLHLGMYAWAPETGADYDVKIAVGAALTALRTLVAQSHPSARAVILGLGDYFHSNDAKAVTPESGHRLDVDGRWARVFSAGARLATLMVETVARKHDQVEVVFLPGNHDPDAAISLRVALGLFYRRNPRITVNQQPGIAWFHRFGRVLLGATHGHTMKPDKMAMMLAADRPQDWGETEYRHMFFGHIHHERALEVGPVRVESFSSPAARDAWNTAGGYRAGRALGAITFHRDFGEIGRHRVHVGTTRPRVRVRAVS